MSLGTVGAVTIVDEVAAVGTVKHVRFDFVGDAAYAAGGSLGLEDAVSKAAGEDLHLLDVRACGNNGDIAIDFTPRSKEFLCTGVAATDVFTTFAPAASPLVAPVATAHGFASGDPVKFIPDNQGDAGQPTPATLPGGLDPTAVYYVIASGLTTTAFKVSATLGGSTIDFTAASGTGKFAVQKQDTALLRVPSTGSEASTGDKSGTTYHAMAVAY